MSGTQGSDRSCVGGGCAITLASVALDGDECVRDPITPTIAELCTHRHIEFGVLLALWQPSHRPWECGSTEMSVSGFRSSRAVHASSLASLVLPQPCLCHWVPMIAELCTHRFESLVVLGVAATEPEPLQV